MEKYEWHDDPPKENGDYFYTGPLPDGEEVVAIAQVFAHPETGERMACVFIPPGWREDKARIHPKVHFGTLDKWTGQWAGPEFGLCCASA